MNIKKPVNKIILLNIIIIIIVIFIHYLHNNKSSDDSRLLNKDNIQLSNTNNNKIDNNRNINITQINKVKDIVKKVENDKLNNVEIPYLDDMVGKETADAISNNGPYKTKHVRRMAKGLKNYENLLKTVSKGNYDPEQIEELYRDYYSLQNSYYAATSELDPHIVYKPAAERIEKYINLIKDKDYSIEEKQEIKRNIMLTSKDYSKENRIFDKKNIEQEGRK